MALNNMGLGLTFTAINGLTGPLNTMSGRFGSFRNQVVSGSSQMQSSFSATAAGLTALAAGGAIVKGGFALAGAAGKFEQQMVAIGAITRATAEELKELENAAIKAGLETQFSPGEAASGLQALGQAGLSATDSITALQPALDLASASLGELSIEDSAGLAIQGMKTFGFAADESGLAVDKMLRTTQSFQISTGQLPLALGNVARGALALNANLDDTLIGLGLVKNVMPRVESASAAAGRAMELLAKPSTQKALKKTFNVTAIDKATGKFRPFLDVINDLTKASSKMTQVELAAGVQKAFGARGAGGVLIMMKQLKDGIKTSTGETVRFDDAIAHLRGEMASAGGTTAGFRNKLLDTFEGQKTLLKGTLQTLAVEVGKVFTKIFRPVVEGFLNNTKRILNIFRTLNPAIQDMIGRWTILGAGILSAVGVLLTASVALSAFGGIIITIGAALASMVQTVLGLGVVFAIVGTEVLIWRTVWEENVGGARDFLKGAFADVALIWQGLIQMVRDGGFSGAVGEEFEKAENSGLGRFVLALTGLVDVGRSFVDTFVSTVREGIGGQDSIFGPFFKAIGFFVATLRDTFSVFSEVMQEVGVLDFVGELVGRVITTIVGIGGVLLTLWASFRGGFIQGILAVVQVIKPFIGIIIDALSTVTNAIFDAIDFVLPFFSLLVKPLLWIGFILGVLFVAKAALFIAAIGITIAGFIWAGRVVWSFLEIIIDAVKWVGSFLVDAFLFARDIFFGFGETLSDVGATASESFGAIITGVKFLGSAFIVGVRVLIGALGSVVSFLGGKFGAGLRKTFGVFKTIVGAIARVLVDVLAGTVSLVFAGIKIGFQVFAAFFNTFVRPPLEAFFAFIAPFALRIAGVFREHIIPAVTTAVEFMREKLGAIGAFLDENVKPPLMAFGGWIKNVVDGIASVFSIALDFFAPLGEALASSVNKVMDFARSTINGLPDSVKKFLPDTVLEFAGVSVTSGGAISAAAGEGIAIAGQTLDPGNTGAAGAAAAAALSPSPIERRSVSAFGPSRVGSLERAAGGGDGDRFDRIAALIEASQNKPIEVKVEVDGEAIARASANGQRESDARSFLATD